MEKEQSDNLTNFDKNKKGKELAIVYEKILKNKGISEISEKRKMEARTEEATNQMKQQKNCSSSAGKNQQGNQDNKTTPNRNEKMCTSAMETTNAAICKKATVIIGYSMLEPKKTMQK